MIRAYDVYEAMTGKISLEIHSFKLILMVAQTKMMVSRFHSLKSTTSFKTYSTCWVTAPSSIIIVLKSLGTNGSKKVPRIHHITVTYPRVPSSHSTHVSPSVCLLTFTLLLTPSPPQATCSYTKPGASTPTTATTGLRTGAT